MALADIARQMAPQLAAEFVEGGDDYTGHIIQGQGWKAIVKNFFGGWQVEVHRQGYPQPVVLFGEDVAAMIFRIKAKLGGLELPDQ